MKTMNWALGMAVALSSASVWSNETAVAYERGGGGYHGPTWETISIPGTVDRAISEKDIAAAAKVCYVTGDPASGLQSMIQKLILQVNGKEILLTQTFSGSGSGGEGLLDIRQAKCRGAECEILNYYNSYFQNSLKGPDARNGQMNFTQNYYFDKRIKQFRLKSGYGISLTSGEYPASQSKDVGGELSMHLPIFAYAKKVAERTYDEWGDVKTAAIFSGLSLQVPKEFDKKGDSVQLINSRTGKPMAARVNLKELVECLSGQIQKVVR